MRKAFRYEDNSLYWDRRWSESGIDEDRFNDLTIYPIKYAEMVVQKDSERIVELGCGLGRVLKHYHYQNKNIVGVEYSRIALQKLKKENKDLKLVVADVRHLPFKDGVFDTVLAFGLFHNIEHGMLDSVEASLKCLKLGGGFSISMRPDNIEMRFNEFYWRSKQKTDADQQKHFHKWLVGEGEFKNILQNFGMYIGQVFRARNVSLLWRIPLLRASTRKKTESDLRSSGYQLNLLGKWIDKFLVCFFSASFCNVLVFSGKKDRDTF
jgi:SAM-dependent methyltransferase